MGASFYYRWLVLLLLSWIAPQVAGGEGAASFEQAVEPFFREHCIGCHGAEKQKGDFRLDTLARDFNSEASASRWGEVLFRMNAGELPPRKEKQPSAAALGAVASWLSARLEEGRAARMAARGPVAHYRLSRDEYGATVYDLLGVHFDVNLPGLLNEDPRWHGFERIGSMLSLSPSHVDRYMNAAEVVLERAFAPVGKPGKQRHEAYEGQQKKWAEEHGVKGTLRWPMWPLNRRHAFSITAPGRYRVKIQLSGMQTAEGRAPHLSIWQDALKRSVYDQDVIAPEDKPTILDFEMVLSAGGYTLINEMPQAFSEIGNHTLNVLNGGGTIFTSTKDLRFVNPTGYQLFDDEGRAMYPMLLVDWVECEGPLVSSEEMKKREGLLPAKAGDMGEARECLRRFATRAWRRPANEGELDRYVKVIEEEMKAGENFAAAYRAAMVGVLSSKNFYFIEEGSAAKPRERVNDWELASRLSYFLWGSMPDEGLFKQAEAGKLHEAEVLRGELARMIADGKCRRFVEAFPRQWLELYKIGMFPPDPKLYPDYDKWLEKSMALEAQEVFGEVFAKNLSLREFIQADWTMANPRLAAHYGFAPLQKSGFGRIALRPEDHRGGLLTQAGVLMLTSDGTRHRPVHRGVWLSEVIFGKTPPPPPPNVQPIEPIPQDKPKTTVRAQLEAHATNVNCASCHQKIDPLGIAFDNYDAIGRWRTEEIVSSGKGANPPVNASGKLPDGREFKTPEEFKALLAADVDRFAEAFAGQLATFALRRVMTMDDAAQLKAIAEAGKKQDYRLGAMIEGLVMSDLFQKR